MIVPLYKNKEWLYQKYVVEGLSTNKIGEMFNINQKTIWYWLKKYDINIRSNINENPTVNDFFYIVFDGLMLGDGSIHIPSTKNARFSIGQRYDKIGWLNWIKNIFDKYNIEYVMYNNESRKFISPTNNKEYKNKPSITLSTKLYGLFTKEYNRWYDNGEKIIPDDVRLSPISLAQWYMGDGDLYCDKRKWIRYTVEISTLQFTKDELKELVDKIDDLYKIKFNINRFYKNRENRGYRLRTGKKHQVYKFCKLIEPHIVDCFKYKIRCLEDEVWLNKL